jgi:ABC-type nitrate/sulfonate/bicarbonate transport system substrate-binding protein
MTTRDDRRINRRTFLTASGSAVLSTAALSASYWGRFSGALAMEVKPLSFQLSWVKSIQYGGYFAGIDRGIFKKYGVDPTFVSGGPNVDPIANVASGQSVLGDRPIGPLIIAREKGIPIKVIGTVFQTSPYSIMSLPAKPIRSIKELRGKTIACATSGRPMLLYLIKEAGLEPNSVNIVPSSPDPSALVSGQIDAYAGYSTNQGVMLQHRGVEIVNLLVHDLGLPETTGTIYGREDFLTKNRELVVQFLRAAIESWRWALDHPEETAKFMVDKYGNPGLNYGQQLTEIKVSKPFMEAGPVAQKGLLALDLALYAKIIDLYRNVGIVKTGMKVEDLCDSSYVEAALAAKS